MESVRNSGKWQKTFKVELIGYTRLLRRYDQHTKQSLFGKNTFLSKKGDRGK